MPGYLTSNSSITWRTFRPPAMTVVSPPVRSRISAGIQTVAISRSLGVTNACLYRAHRCQDGGGVHRQVGEAFAGGAVEGVGDRRRWGDDGHFADAAHAEGVPGVGHF